MVAQITCEIMVGITPKIQEAMEIACEFNGMKPSQYARQAIVEKLVREGFIKRPTFKKFDNSCRKFPPSPPNNSEVEIMKVKTAYRTPKIPQPDDKPEPIDGQEAEPLVAVAAELSPEETEDTNEAVREYQKEVEKADEAALALQKQIDALRRSEQIARQYQAAQAAQVRQSLTREQKLAIWKQQGMTQAEERFLSENPEMIDAHELTGFAANEALKAGHRAAPKHTCAPRRKSFTAISNT